MVGAAKDRCHRRTRWQPARLERRHPWRYDRRRRYRYGRRGVQERGRVRFHAQWWRVDTAAEVACLRSPAEQLFRQRCSDRKRHGDHRFIPRQRRRRSRLWFRLRVSAQRRSVGRSPKDFPVRPPARSRFRLQRRAQQFHCGDRRSRRQHRHLRPRLGLCVRQQSHRVHLCAQSDRDCAAARIRGHRQLHRDVAARLPMASNHSGHRAVGDEH